MSGPELPTMKMPSRIIIPVLIILIMAPIIPITTAQVSYDIAYTDPVGDVQALTRAGKELLDVDITSLSSKMEQTLLTKEDQIILIMQVKGKISTTNSTGYIVQMESDDEFYVFQYAGGVCVEIYSGKD